MSQVSPRPESFGLAASWKRTAWICACLMVLIALGMASAVHMVERIDPDAELRGDLMWPATACLVIAALVLYFVYRWRVVFDAHGIRYRGFLFTTQWPWRDFEEGRVWIGDQSVQHTGKKWLMTMWLGLSLTPDTEDVSQHLARGVPVSPPMQALRARGPFPQPDVPDRLELRVGPVKKGESIYLSMSRQGVSLGREDVRRRHPVGRYHERTWSELGPVRFVMRRATDVGFWRLRISLPDKPTEYRIAAASGDGTKWNGDIGSVIARRYIERVLPADRLEPPLILERPQTAADIDDVVSILQNARNRTRSALVGPVPLTCNLAWFFFLALFFFLLLKGSKALERSPAFWIWIGLLLAPMAVIISDILLRLRLLKARINVLKDQRRVMQAQEEQSTTPR